MANFNVGETVYLQIEIRDPVTNVLTDPATSIKLQVYKPDGSSYLALTDMVRVSTGIYGYNLGTAGSDTIGKYQVKFTVTDGTAITIEWYQFTLGK